MSLDYVQSNTLYLAGSGVTVGATSITLTTFTDIYGNVLTMADFGAKGYITLEPDTTNEEAATFTGVTANANGTFTLTGVATALAQSPYTETSGLVRSHTGGTKVVITDNVAFWNTFANKNNNETILGTWTFQNAPVALSATPASPTTLGNVKLTSTPDTNLGNPTITIASPAVITLANHGLIAGDSIQLSTTGTLPTGLVPSTNYYVIAAGLTTNTFEVSATSGGSAINTSGSQSGTHTLYRTTPFAIGNDDPRVPSAAAGAGLANAPTTPSSTNPFYTKTDVLAYAQPDYQVFTANGTWTKPTNLLGNELVKIQIWGGGGGGGSSGGVGGGGSFLEVTVPANSLAATVAVTVAAQVGAGVQGNNSSFGSFIAYGGGYGSGTVSGGGAGIMGPGGVGTGGNPVPGVNGAVINSAMGGGANGNNTNAQGGSSVYGGGGGSNASANGGNSVYGGGGGSQSGTGGTSLYGGNGGGTGSPNGVAPAGGGGNNGTGARGEVRVWTIR